ncbi:MAG TPA: hypothetical protein VL997_11380 [Dyella sp.]|nr:hypothetical protein [Dyella sp.]
MTGYPVRTVADAIAGFLAEHPACADTIEGIELWWLNPRGITPPREVIVRALELLEVEQLIECRPIGARKLWRLRRENG